MDKKPQLDDLLTAEQTAAYLSLSPATLRNWRAKRTGPRWLGSQRRVRYRVSDLQAWLERGCP